MQKKNKLAAVFAALLATSILSVSVFAADYTTPAEALAGLTDRTVESIAEEQANSGRSYGAIAADAGKLSEFHAEVLKLREDTLNAQVQSGSITRARADVIMQNIATNQTYCDGTGTGCDSGSCHALASTGTGYGCNGNGYYGNSNGNSRGYGCGMRRR